MAYIGREPQVGNFQVCDAISTVNNQAAYTMQVGSVNVSPESANHMIVSLNGVIQKPTDAYTVSGSTITFASNLVTGDVINFIQILGNVLDLGVPSDSTVSLAKLTATGTKNSTTFLRGDNTFAVPSDNVGIVNLGTTTVTGTPSEIDIDFDTSTYKQFRIFYEGIQATADFNMFARAKVGGSIITASNYNSATVKKYASGFDTNTYGGNNQAYWYVTNNIGGDTNENWGADILINIGSGTGMPQLTINCAYRDAGGLYIANWGTLTYQNFSIINGFRIYPSTGTFDAGKYTVWGIK